MSSEADSAIPPDESRSGALIAVVITFTVLIVLTASFRLCAKVYAKLTLTPDDYFIFATTVLNIVANAFDIKACTSGFGRHAHYLDLDSEIEALKFGQLAVGLAGIAYWSAKMSICFFILQIVRGTTHRVFRIGIYALMGIITISSFISLLLWGLQANPFPRSWDPRIPGTSQDPQIFLDGVYFNYAMNIFVNVLYSLSPLYFLWSVQMSGRKKLVIFGLIGSGFLIIVISSLNIAFAHDFLNRTDPTWVLVNEFLCDIIERNFTVVVANLPGLWMLGGQLRKSYATYRTQNRTYYGDNATAAGFRSHAPRSSNPDKSLTPISHVSRKQQGGRKGAWERVGEGSDFGDTLPLTDVSASADRSAAALDAHGGIQVRTDISISEEHIKGEHAHEGSDMC